MKDKPTWKRSIPKWEQGRITEEQWTPKPKTYEDTSSNISKETIRSDGDRRKTS